jgi:uncharacterized protein (DUF736 family)
MLAKPPGGLSSGLVWHRPGLGLQRLRRPSSPDRKRSFLANQQARLTPSSAHAAVLRMRTSGPSPLDRHRGRIGRLRATLRRYDKGSDRHLHPRRKRRLRRTIKTSPSTSRPVIKPCDRDNDKAPDYRVTANGVEFGAGWGRTARETGAEYLSLKLDDLSFTAPVYQGDKGEHKLIWSR